MAVMRSRKRSTTRRRSKREREREREREKFIDNQKVLLTIKKRSRTKMRGTCTGGGGLIQSKKAVKHGVDGGGFCSFDMKKEF